MHVFFNDLKIKQTILRLEHRGHSTRPHSTVSSLRYFRKMSVGGVRHTAELKHYPFLKRHIIKEHTDFQALVPASTKFCPISVQKVGAKNHSRWLRKRLYGLYGIPPAISLV